MASSKLQWFVFVIIIPLLFAIVLYSLILHFMDKSIVSQMKAVGEHIPVVSEWIDDEERAANVGEDEDEDSEITRLTDKVQAQADEIAELKQKLLAQDEEIVQYKEQIAKLEKQLEEQEDGPEQTARDSKIKKTGELLLAMSPKEAAQVVADMRNEDIVELMETIDASEMGRILAKMEPERASELTTILLSN